MYAFEAAHRLEWHQGKCNRLHGHTYRLEVLVSGDLDKNGVIEDFSDVDAVVEAQVLSRLDHQYLNEIIPNPTAEETVLYIGAALDDGRLAWGRLRLWETSLGSVLLER